MKIRIAWVALCLAALSTFLFTGRGLTQDKQNSISADTVMSADTVVIDVSKIGKKMNAPEDTIPLPGGKTFQLQRWNKEHLNKAIEELKYCFKSPEKTYLLTEVPAPWITLALIQALQPLKVHYLYPAAGGTDLDLMRLKRGKAEAAENYDARFEVKEEGDNVYINLATDKPGTPEGGGHTFDLKNLPKVVIPEIPAGKNVFIHGKGAYGPMVIIAWNYAKDAKTLSMAAHETDYVCAISHSKTLEPGDVTKRTRENNL